ncbi:hypothetical protein QBC41DRAFT_275457 [Cercophora samala]|uniref:Putative gamma-glutamylcyclotransferase n=1 Tax=Cercophora samala TaxID=330535 RepID=A0AA39ZDR0_9PEZI|nr:hypothetical protein QBC41DRAFT_275457 [Cercophora samala]
MTNSPPPPPSPAPLPPKPSMKPSLNFISKPASKSPDHLPPPIPKDTPTAYSPTYFFFYGTLTQPPTLKSVLNLPEETEPVLLPASITGYELTEWGSYKALINGHSTIRGKAYLVESREHQDRLSYYETNAYEIRSCRMEVEDEPERARGEVRGKTFMYAGDGEALKEGRFDRFLWEKRMGVELPRGFGDGMGAE